MCGEDFIPFSILCNVWQNFLYTSICFIIEKIFVPYFRLSIHSKNRKVIVFNRYGAFTEIKRSGRKHFNSDVRILYNVRYVTEQMKPANFIAHNARKGNYIEGSMKCDYLSVCYRT